MADTARAAARTSDAAAIAKLKADDAVFSEFMKVDVLESSLTSSHDRIISLDHRPYWEAAGRVQNRADDRDVKTAVVRFYALDPDGNQYDTADVTLHNIARNETRAFKQTIWLLPPKLPKWTYKADVMAVEFTDGVKYPQE